jgi:putative peptidoglycan lipid II flippase
MRRLVGRGLSTVATVLMPVWGFLMVCSVPLVALVFEHGSFTPSDTQHTATAILWYAPALLALGWREMVVRASYALGDSRRPVTVFIMAMTINVVGDFTLGLTFGIAGIAASTSLSVLFAAVANTVLLGRRHDAVDLRSLPLMVGRTGAAAAVGTAAGAGVYWLLDPHLGTGLVNEILLLVPVGLTLVAVFIGVLYALRAPERRLLGEAIDVVVARRRR